MADGGIFNVIGSNGTTFKLRLNDNWFNTGDVITLSSLGEQYHASLYRDDMDEDMVKLAIYISLSDIPNVYVKIRYEDSYDRSIEALTIDGVPLTSDIRYKRIMLRIVESLIEEAREDIEHEAAIIKLRFHGGRPGGIRYTTRIKIRKDGGKTFIKKGILPITNFNKT